MKQGFDLREPRVDADDRGCALGQEVVAERTAPVHLDEQAPEFAQRIFARLEEGAPLAAEQSGVRPMRGNTLDMATPAEER